MGTFIGWGGGGGGAGPMGPSLLKPGLVMELGVEIGGTLGPEFIPDWVEVAAAAAAIAAFILAACNPGNMGKGCDPWNWGFRPNILSRGGKGGLKPLFIIKI